LSIILQCNRCLQGVITPFEYYFTMQCNPEKFQPGQIEFLTENREGIKVCVA